MYQIKDYQSVYYDIEAESGGTVMQRKIGIGKQDFAA